MAVQLFIPSPTCLQKWAKKQTQLAGHLGRQTHHSTASTAMMKLASFLSFFAS
jgi:hypothetical protein